MQRDLSRSLGIAVAGAGAAIGSAAALSGLGVGGHLSIRRVDNHRGAIIDDQVGHALGAVGCTTALIYLEVSEGGHKVAVRRRGIATGIGCKDLLRPTIQFRDLLVRENWVVFQFLGPLERR